MFKYLLLLLPILGLKAENCSNEWALNKVNVRLYKTFNDKFELKVNVSINILKNYESIEVIGSNVSVLCQGMVQNFPVLTHLSLIEANISKIQPEAFLQVPKLRHLSLAINHLKSLARSQLANLVNLNILYLSSNDIDHIEEDAFEDLHNIKKIYIDRNKIIEIQSKWFLNKPVISVIDLSFNRLSKIQSAAFTLPTSGTVKIELRHNLIEEIEAKAVIGGNNKEHEKPHVTLHLGRNSLNTVASEFLANMDRFDSVIIFDNNNIRCFPPETLRILQNISVSLQVAKNPLTCDCFVAATNYVNDHEIRAKFSFTTTEQCPLHFI